MTEQADEPENPVGTAPGIPRPDAEPGLPFVQWLCSLATAAYVCVLIYATHHPRPQELIGEGPDVPSDKSLHFAAYFVLGVLASATLAAWRHWTLAAVVGLTAALLVFGALDEVTQPLFGRFADVADWFADCRGVVAGILAVAAILAALAPRASPRQ